MNHEFLAIGQTLEMRRRLDVLLDRIDRRELTGEQLQAVRAIDVLECIATPAARELLESLARGTLEALRSCEAQAALGQMKR
jgi:hypothetical protein